MRTTLQHLTIMSLVAAVLLGGLLWSLHLLYGQATELRAALQTIENEAAVNQAYRSLSELLDATAADRNALARYVVDGEAGTVALLDELEALAAQWQLALDTTKVETETANALNTETLLIDLAVTGRPQYVRSFIALLETLPYASYLRNVSYTTSRSSPQARQTSAQLTLVVAISNLDV